VEIEKMGKILEAVSGKLFIKSYPKFNTKVSTIDIKNSIARFRKHYGSNPDVVIIDSLDLLTDASGKKWSENGVRHQRISVANDLKDLAADEKVWIVATYQATIENRDLLNDEKKVLTEYNCAEAKGLARPLTHLITLNQSDRERKERTMRINVAKSRFFEKGEPFRIATNYNAEQFYDSVRTLNLNKIN
jgi:archaellum biogenesis ATPase FlaH